jgi:hypothetical protein
LGTFDVLSLANERHPEWRASERLALAELSLWELLHLGQLRLLKDGEVVDRRDWEQAILSWGTWASDSPLVLEAAT